MLSTKRRNPVVRRAAILAVAPDIPITFGIVFCRAGFDKPWVLIGTVIHYKIEKMRTPLLFPSAAMASKSASVPYIGSMFS